MNESITKDLSEEEKREIAKSYAKDLDVEKLGKPHDHEKFRAICEALSYENIEDLREQIKAGVEEHVWEKVMKLLDDLENLNTLDYPAAEPRYQYIMQEFYEILDDLWAAETEEQDLALKIVLLLHETNKRK